MSAVRKPASADKREFPDVYLKPGLDNLLIALQAVVSDKLPANVIEFKIYALREWAHRTGQQDGEIHGLVIKTRKRC